MASGRERVGEAADERADGDSDADELSPRLRRRERQRAEPPFFRFRRDEGGAERLRALQRDANALQRCRRVGLLSMDRSERAGKRANQNDASGTSAHVAAGPSQERRLVSRTRRLGRVWPGDGRAGARLRSIHL